MAKVECHSYGNPLWWSDYSEHWCELEPNHDGPHRMVVEWEDINWLPEEETQ